MFVLERFEKVPITAASLRRNRTEDYCANRIHSQYLQLRVTAGQQDTTAVLMIDNCEKTWNIV